MALDEHKIDSLKIDPEHRVRQGNRLGILAFVGAGLVIGAVVAWQLWPREPAPEVSIVAASAPSQAESSANSAILNASGYVVARRLATVSSKVTGKIEEVLVEEGMTVEAGDVLARLDGATATVQLNLAQSQLEAARKNLAEIEVRLGEARRQLERNGALRERKLISAQVYDASESEVKALEARLISARGSVDVAEQSVAVARQAVEDLTIRAPFGGVVISKNAQPGEMISPMSSGGFTRTGICTIVDMDSREIEVDVNEAYINRVEPGQRVEATLDAYPDWSIPAEVINIVPTADRQKATVKVRIGFDQLDSRILPDMGVKVGFLEEADDPVEEEALDAVALVPPSAVSTLEGRRYVWVVDGETVERRAVSTGRERGGLVAVRSGLRPGERIVATPPDGLSDGQQVKIAN